MARAIGKELLTAVRAVDDDAEAVISGAVPDEAIVVLHPAVTVGDLIWLDIELQACAVPLFTFPHGLHPDDDTWIGSLRGQVRESMRTLQMTRGLLVELSRFDDGIDLFTPSALQGSRGVLAAGIHAFRATVETLVAESTDESTAWADEAAGAKESLNVALTGLARTRDEDHVRHWEPRQVWKRAFGAAPTGPDYSLKGLTTAYQGMDPFASEYHRASGLFPIPEPAARTALNAADRLLVFAERQLRFIGMPSPPLDLNIVQDCFQLGYRLAAQSCPALAHICGGQMALLLRSANEVNPPATRARLLRFQTEDAPLIIDAAVRSDRDMQQGQDRPDPLQMLGGHRRLLEGLVRQWLRFVLDIIDIALDRKQRAIPATVRIGTLLEQTRASLDDAWLLQLLTDPILPALRNADAHERAALGLDGMLNIYGDTGQTESKVAPDEIRGRYAVLRSAFAGVDCATSSFNHGIRLELPEGTRLTLTPDMFQRFAEITSTVSNQPNVQHTKIDTVSGTLLVEVDAEWDAEIAQRMSDGFHRLAPEIRRVVLRDHRGETRYDAQAEIPEPPSR